MSTRLSFIAFIVVALALAGCVEQTTTEQSALEQRSASDSSSAAQPTQGGVFSSGNDEDAVETASPNAALPSDGPSLVPRFVTGDGPVLLGANRTTYNLSGSIGASCSFERVLGGPLTLSISVDIATPEALLLETRGIKLQRFDFSYSVPASEIEEVSLFATGPLPSTDGANYYISTSHPLSGYSYRWGALSAEQMEIVWERVDGSADDFKGEGYIVLKQPIVKNFNGHRGWNGTEYYIVDDDLVIDTYVPQRIPFRCGPAE